MSFQLRASESVNQGVRRVVRACLDDACRLLEQPGDIHFRVHETRKRLKEIRAILRLIHPGLGDQWTRENHFFRDTARSLSGLRDARALMETWEKLSARHALPDDQFAVVRARLDQSVEQQSLETAGNMQVFLQDIARDLSQARQRVKHWSPGKDFSALSPGLRQGYQQGRKRLANLACPPTDDELHEWRKWVKHHWYHYRLLQGLDPAVFKVWQKQLKKLTEKLGDYHDLVLLREHLRLNMTSLGGLGEETQMLPLLDKIEDYQQELLYQARQLGWRLFAEKPGAFIDRMNLLWQQWHRGL